ncbi:MAG: mannose-1-phosphate guanylyltransferase [Candidatus Marinamargulisbacteria bacterium]
MKRHMYLHETPPTPYNDTIMLHAVIMAGGKGTRFWPLSRSVKAKQFLNIIGEHSFLKQTVLRVNSLIPNDNIWVVSNKHQKDYVDAEVGGMVPESQVLLEPMGRNTAPCIGWAAAEIVAKDPDATMVILPSDHFIKEDDKFCDTLRAAADEAIANQTLVTIGIPPESPHTGYGYIEAKNAHESVMNVTSFTEKPDIETAQAYLETGRYFWNSGIFVWQAKTILASMKKHLVKNYDILETIVGLPKDETYSDKLDELYQTLTSISIDYGVMEHESENIRAIKSNFSWSDIGNWTSVEEFWKTPDNENAAKGKVVSLNSSGNIVYSKKRLVALVDVENYIIIDDEDALLVLPKTSDQKLRALYDVLPDSYK